MRPTGYPETLARNHQCSLRNDPEERSPHLHRNGSPPTRTLMQLAVPSSVHHSTQLAVPSSVHHSTVTYSTVRYTATVCLCIPAFLHGSDVQHDYRTESDAV